jgi:endonuclease/exonuclease/phosphatase family metal-dependent hydrolase
VALLAVFRFAGYFTEPRLTDAQIHAIDGEPARVTSVPIDHRDTKVVTWNIERGVHFQKIASTLGALAPDVVLLQEVDRYCRRSGNHDVARELARVLGMNWVAAGEFQEIGEAGGPPAATTGQAILSRAAITDPGVIVFSDQSLLRWRLNPLQPRRGGRIALRARTAGLLVYSVHLESGGDDEQRTSQLNEVIADQARHPAEHAVIAGDFNNEVAFQSFMFAGLAPAGFADALDNTPGDARRTSINHRHPIDWLFVKGAAHTTGRVERVDDASDHYPVVATVTLRR